MRWTSGGAVPDSYSLREVAELLGTSLDGVVRRVEQGEFPGRFLTGEFEMRIPVADLRRALETARPASAPASDPRTEWTSDPGLPSVPPPEALIRWFEERAQAQERQMAELLDHVLEIKGELEQLRRSVEELRSPAEPLELLPGPPDSDLDVDGLLREVAELESMLGLPEDLS